MTTISTSGCPNVISEYTLGESNDLTILFRVYRNVMECFKNRGYIVPEVYSSEEELLSIVHHKEDPEVEHLDTIVTHPVSGKRCLLAWVRDEKIGVKHIKKIYDKMEKENIHDACMLCKYTITVFGKKAIEEFNTTFSDKYIEYFEYSQMLIDITKHTLVPKHIVLSREEKEKWFGTFSIKKESQLPKLHRTDAMARYYGLRKGDLVKIIRQSDAGTEYIMYRIVV
jgi:DNA-directed RNA polymerase I, II, and III subunit RPABC1